MVINIYDNEINAKKVTKKQVKDFLHNKNNETFLGRIEKNGNSYDIKITMETVSQGYRPRDYRYSIWLRGEEDGPTEGQSDNYELTYSKMLNTIRKYEKEQCK
jgi:hypothetical protein